MTRLARKSRVLNDQSEMLNDSTNTHHSGGRGKEHDDHCNAHCYASHNPTAASRISIKKHSKMFGGTVRRKQVLLAPGSPVRGRVKTSPQYKHS